MEGTSMMSLSSLRDLAKEAGSTDLLWDVLKNSGGDLYALQYIIENPVSHADPELIRAVYNAGDYITKATILGDTDDETLLDIAATDDSVVVREAAVKNPHMRYETFMRLAKDEQCYGIQLAILSSPRVTEDIVRMYVDAGYNVHYLVRMNAQEMLFKMTSDAQN